MTTLAGNIVVIRKHWCLNQTEFAALLGATRIQVSNWERGRTVPGIESLQALKQASGISVDRLHGEELTTDCIPLQPGGAVGAWDSNPISLELRKINSRLDAIEALLHRLIS